MYHMPFKDKAVKALYDQRRYQSNLEFIREYKLEHGCKDCGYREHFAGLEFDHLGEKYKNVSELLNGTRERLMREIEKCDVVCGTCHNIRTWSRRVDKRLSSVV